ncbi:MAG TPA: DUF1579 domain-containing protein [Thermoanaerobaculia bacterium]|jgi:hypothetical protein
MNRRILFVLLTLLLYCGLAVADDQEMDAAPEMTPEQQAGMEAMMKAATPGEHHEHMNHLVGNWTYDITMWMEPGAPPMKSQGTTEAKWFYDGRFIETVVKGEFMGDSFEGRGIDGYDNGAGHHFGFWVDNMGTMSIFSTGQCSEGGKVTTMMAEFVDPMTGQAVKQRGVTRIVDHDHHVMEMYHVLGDGTEHKVLEMTATRQ